MRQPRLLVALLLLTGCPRPQLVTLSAAPATVTADGASTAVITVSIVDDRGRP